MTFRNSFSALTDRVPFPWQQRLFERISSGDYPPRCDVPTGLGKTGVIAAWLAALGSSLDGSAHAAPVPRRLVYVVDRRAVVDQATAEAEHMRRRLLEAEDGSALADLRSALMAACAVPIEAGVTISTLRGQFADNHEWDLDASRPAIIVGTVDMIGSRLLFAGYGGLGRHRRSLHGGLLAQDSLIVLDEAHLSLAFATTLLGIRRRIASLGSLRPFQVLLLTATQPQLHFEERDVNKTAKAKNLSIEKDDRANEEVGRRLKAPKAMSFVEPPKAESQSKAKIDRDAFAKRMAEEAVELSHMPNGENRAVVIFADSVDLLTRVNAALKSEPHKIADAQRLVLTGEMRGKERDAFAEKPLFKTVQTRRRDRGALAQPIFFLTTAAGEVGINFDADDAVCDPVALERFAQRVGRVNRFGDGEARVRIVLPMSIQAVHAHAAELESLISRLPSLGGDERKKVEKRIEELESTLSRYTARACLRLTELAPVTSGYSASPAELSELCRADGATDAYSPSSPPPPLDDARLDDWAFTSLRAAEYARPQVSYWLRGLTPDDTVATTLVWREDIGLAVDEDSAATMAQMIPLASAEKAQVASYRAAELLAKAAEAHPEAIAALLTSSGEWQGIYLRDLPEKSEEIGRLIAFATIILPSSVGGLKDGLPDKGSRERVPDAVDRERYRRFRISHSDGDWLAHEIPVADDDPSCASGGSAEDVCRDLVANLRPGFKRVFLSEAPEKKPLAARVLYLAKAGALLESPGAADIASLLRRDIPLAAHNSDAERFAQRLVDRLALPKNVADAVVRAAARHDLGKDRPQWQSAIGNSGKPPLAKSARSGFDRHASGGYRHEFGSMLEAAKDPLVRDHPERDLILHLIAAHHGHARPSFAETGFDSPRLMLRECAKAALEAEERYVALQRRFGWWQLAYLEALVKSADALASKNHDEESTPANEPPSQP